MNNEFLWPFFRIVYYNFICHCFLDKLSKIFVELENLVAINVTRKALGDGAFELDIWERVSTRKTHSKDATNLK